MKDKTIDFSIARDSEDFDKVKEIVWIKDESSVLSNLKTDIPSRTFLVHH